MSREAYKLAVGFFLDTVAVIKPDQWENNALGVWNLRDLVGHTARAITNVELYAKVGAGGRTVDRANSEAVVERGREAGRQLGDDPLVAVRAHAERVLAFMDGIPDDHTLDAVAGNMTLLGYLPSRVQELTTHSIDIARTIGHEAEPPDECLRVSLYWYVDRLIQRGTGVEVVLALTGREPLPDGFNVFG